MTAWPIAGASMGTRINTAITIDMICAMPRPANLSRISEVVTVRVPLRQALEESVR